MLQHTGARKGSGLSQCLSRVPGSVRPVHSANHRLPMQTGEQWAGKPAPGSSDTAWLHSCLESMKVALGQPFGSPCPGRLHGQKAAGAAAGPRLLWVSPGPSTGPSWSSSQACLDTEQPAPTYNGGDTILSAGLAQGRPGIVTKSDFMGQHMACWVPSIIPMFYSEG